MLGWGQGCWMVHPRVLDGLSNGVAVGVHGVGRTLLEPWLGCLSGWASAVRLTPSAQKPPVREIPKADGGDGG